MLQTVLEDIHVPRRGPGRAGACPGAVLVDPGYATTVTHCHLREQGIVAARQHKGSEDGRPHAFDAQGYKGRNVVEQAFALVKQGRGLATRYAKLAVVPRGAVVLCAVVAWLRVLGETPGTWSVTRGMKT